MSVWDVLVWGYEGFRVKVLVCVRSGEAMSLGLLSKAMVSELFLVVALTMALTPLLAEIGQRLGKAFEKSDVKVRHNQIGVQYAQDYWLAPTARCLGLGSAWARPVKQSGGPMPWRRPTRMQKRWCTPHLHFHPSALSCLNEHSLVAA